jgi:hypothetical protein
MNVVSVKVWASVDVRFVRECNYGFGAQAEARVDDGEDPSIVADELYQKVVRQSILKQMAMVAAGDQLFKIAVTMERPRIIKNYEKVNDAVSNPPRR